MNELKESQYIFYMLCAILSKKSVPVVKENMNWEKIYDICAYHKIENIISYAIDELLKNSEFKDSISNELKVKFNNAKYNSIMREVIQQNETERLITLFEQEKVDILLLKGSILKHYYPSVDMRFLIDVDLLAKQKDRVKIRKLMEEHGYKFYHGGDHHDVYLKKPCLTIEIHWNCNTGYSSLDDCLLNVWNNSNLVDGFKHLYEMSLENFYLFQVGHFAKHFEHGGVGLNRLLDFLIFQEKLKNKCNFVEIKQSLENARLNRLVEKVYQIIEKGQNQESLETDLLWKYVMNCGANAKYDFWAQNEIGKSRNKFEYLMKRIFLSREIMQESNTWLIKYPSLIWLAWILRIYKKIICSPSRIVKEIRILKNKEERNNIMKIMKEMGLGDKDEYVSNS